MNVICCALPYVDNRLLVKLSFYTPYSQQGKRFT